MSRFYGELWGKARTTATREGTEKSGLEAHLRGWKVGVRVYLDVDDEGRDRIRIYRTGGSTDPASMGAPLVEVSGEGGKP